MKMSEVDQLDRALKEALTIYVEDAKEFGILFSGGVDSSLLAKICLDLGISPPLITVYMQGSSDEKYVREAASFFDLEHIEKIIFEEEIEKYLYLVREATGLVNHLDLSIGLSLYAGLETASWIGLKHAMVGQGADELFAGYNRYLKMKTRELEKVLKIDVETINIKRDNDIATSLGIELLTPYLHKPFITEVLTIPVEYKIKKGVRKFILREVARKRGLPELICSREKKAIQYSTGVNNKVKKAFKKLIR